MSPELTDRVIGPAVDFVQQNGRAFLKEVGAQGRDRGGGATNVEPVRREWRPLRAELTVRPLMPLWEAQIFVLWKVLIPGSLGLVPLPLPTELFGWRSPEYKYFENKRLCGQIYLEYTAYHTQPF